MVVLGFVFVAAHLAVQLVSQIINGGMNDYNQLWNIIADSTLGEDVSTRRKMLQKGTDVAVPAAPVSTATQLCIQNFLGFPQVGIINTRVLGNVRLRLTLAPVAIMAKAAGVTTENYALSDIFFSVDCFDLEPMFHQAVDKYLHGGGAIEIPFPNYFSFSSSASSLSQTTKFSLSSQSLDKVWGCFALGGNYATNAASASAADFVNQHTNSSGYFTRPANGVVRFGQSATNYTDITDHGG